MKRLIFLLVFLIPAVGFAQTKHARPYQGSFGVTAYYDTDKVKGNGSDEDYACNAFAYDGHGGTDYGLPLGSTVIASAAGTVNRTNDSCPDYGGLGSTCGGYLGNWVELKHEDGTMTMYAHMKRGSIAVSPGQTVTCGQRLGQSASSGNSSGPHLHWGNRVAGSTTWGITGTRDIHQGGCSRNNSLWVAQGAYKAAPGAECQDDNRPRDIDLRINVTELEDKLTQGSSAERPDALPEQTFEVRLRINNKAGEAIRDVVLAYEIANPNLVAVDYVIESNVSGDWAVNDADSDENNPAKDAMGASGDLTMYAFADGESKRVRITMVAMEPTLGVEVESAVRGFVRNVQGLYAQGSFGAEPSESRTDEKLEVQQHIDVLTDDAWAFESEEPEMAEGWAPCEGGTEAFMEAGQGLAVRGSETCLESPVWTDIAADTNELLLEIAAEQSLDFTLEWSTSEAFEPAGNARFTAESGRNAVYLGEGWAGAKRLRIRTSGNYHLTDLRFQPGTPIVDPGTDDDVVRPDVDVDLGEGDDKSTTPDAVYNQEDGRMVISGTGGGCNAAGAGASWMALLLVAFGVRRRRE